MKKIGAIGDIAKRRNEMTVEEAGRITERAESLVSQSHDLIATATLLIAEARQLVLQAKAKTRSGHAKSKRWPSGTPPKTETDGCMGNPNIAPCVRWHRWHLTACK